MSSSDVAAVDAVEIESRMHDAVARVCGVFTLSKERITRFDLRGRAAAG